MNASRQAIAIALGGGGAKGYAHLGVLRVLLDAGYDIRAIAGTSVGAIIGALFAAGYTIDEIAARVRSVPPAEAFRRAPDDLPAFLGLRGIAEMLHRALGDRTFAALERPLGVTAVDLRSGRLVYIRSGPVVPAVLASSAVPGIFPPVPWGEEHLLVDGGVLDNVPVRLARLLAPDLPVVAVTLTPPPTELQKPEVRFLAQVPVFGQAIQRLRYVQALQTLLRAVDIAGAHFTQLRLQTDQPEVIIRPPVDDVGLLEAENPDEVVRRGEAAAQAALPTLEAVTAQWRRWLPRPRPQFEPDEVLIF